MDQRFRNCIGPKVRELRMAAGLTQDELAAKISVAGLHSFDRVTVAKIESQIRSVYDYELAILAEVLGVDLSSLIPQVRSLKKDLDALMKGRR